MSITGFPSKQISVMVPDPSESLLDMGTGRKTVVFLHGLFGTAHHWLSIMQELCGLYRVVAPQLPVDLQPNRRHKGVQTINELTSHIESTLDDLRLKDFVLCGNSLGGLIAIDYCLRRPDRVAGLVLAGSAGLYERSLTSGMKPRVTREFVRSVISDIFYSRAMITDELVDEWYRSIQDRDYVRFILRISRATRDRSVENELCNLALPTMIVWGRNDEITPPCVAETFKSRIPGAQLRYIDDCGHAPNVEQPQIFASLLKDFLPHCFGAGEGVLATYRRHQILAH